MHMRRYTKTNNNLEKPPINRAASSTIQVEQGDEPSSTYYSFYILPCSGVIVTFSRYVSTHDLATRGVEWDQDSKNCMRNPLKIHHADRYIYDSENVLPHQEKELDIQYSNPVPLNPIIPPAAAEHIHVLPFTVYATM